MSLHYDIYNDLSGINERCLNDCREAIKARRIGFGLEQRLFEELVLTVSRRVGVRRQLSGQAVKV